MKSIHLTVHAVISIDGRLTLAADVLLLHGDPRWNMLAPSDDEPYANLMAEYNPQAILEGSGSFVLESGVIAPLPPCSLDLATLYQSYLPAEIVNAPKRRWFTIIDSRGRVRWMYKEFPGETWAGWHLLVLVSRSTPPEYLEYLRRETIPYLIVGEQGVDLTVALGMLADKCGVERVVATAGGRLSGALLRAGLVDEISLEILPAAIGGRGTPALFDAPPLAANEMPTRLELLACQTLADGRVRLKYRVIRE
jgi:2,5-diamino-6-(ribosylamino)-4(3H)-pyrimidinone 5'-phosphate reductase